MLELQKMPHAEQAMKRVAAWFEQAILDRVPVRFSRHNSQYDTSTALDTQRWPNMKARWFDAEYQVDSFLASLEQATFNAETFPLYWPNLGPEIYASFFGVELEFGEVTSWSKACIHDIEEDDQLEKIRFDPLNPYLKAIDAMTRLAVEKCRGKALVGMSCLGPGIDCVAGWREPQELCMDLILNPDRVKMLMQRSLEPFNDCYEHFHKILTSAGQPSIGWMGIPVIGKTHIVQADFSNMISPAQFNEFCLPYFDEELKNIDHAIFHMDGKGVAHHLDRLLEIKKIKAIQWVQGVGDDQPILQWLPLIRKIQTTGKSVVVDLVPEELEEFISSMKPEGLFLCISTHNDADQPELLKRIQRW